MGNLRASTFDVVSSWNFYNHSQVVDTVKVEWHICGVKEKVSDTVYKNNMNN